MWHDLRLAYRALRRSPGFAIAAVSTLMLGIGANAAMFSAVEALLLRPLPVHGLSQLVFIETHFPKSDVRLNALTPGELHDVGDRRDLFDAVGGYVPTDVNVTGSGAPQRVSAISTAGALFDVFGVRPYVGRLYDSSATFGNSDVVVLSYGLWHDLTGADPKAIGTTVRLDDRSYEIIGVLPPAFRFPRGVQIWTPRQLNANRCYTLDWRDSSSRACKVATTVARVRQGVQMPRLRAALAAAMIGWRHNLPRYYPRDVDQTLLVTPLVDELAGELRPILLLLIGAVGFVLLLVCANVACLQLIRVTRHARGIAVRAALGADTWVIARQPITESLILAIAGGALGIAVAQVLVTLLPSVDPRLFAVIGPLQLDPLVLAFSAGVSLLSVLLFGVAPAIRAARIGAGDTLRSSASRNATAAVGRSRFLSSAVVVQVAITVVLLSGCGVSLRSLLRLLEVDPGFRPAGLITMRVTLPAARYKDVPSRFAFNQALVDRLRGIPGLTAITTAGAAPFDREDKGDRSATAGDKPAQENATLRPLWTLVDSNYFQTVGIPLRAGRTFSGSDAASLRTGTPNAAPVAIIDQTLAEKLFPGEDPIGKKIGPWAPQLTVIGVVGSTKEADIAAAGVGLIYSPGGAAESDQTILVRSQMPLTELAPQLRAAVHDVDPALPVAGISRMTEILSSSLAPRRLASIVLAGIGGLALLLAMLGIYGVLSYSMSQRTKEIGIRLALGARPNAVVHMVLQSGATLAGLGIVAGIVAFAALGSAMSALVFGISARDPVTLTASVALSAIVALLASWIPAQRAARVDPVSALRAEQ
jgi:putative ABC transport system permease protein